MGKDKARNSRDKRHYFQVFHDQIDSPAWRGLSHPARTLLTLFQRRFNGYNKEKIVLPQNTALKYMTGRTFRRARAELITAGFIEIAKHGGLMGQPHVYKLSGKWRASYGRSW